MNEFYKRSQTQNRITALKIYKSNNGRKQFMVLEIRLLWLLWKGGKEI